MPFELMLPASAGGSRKFRIDRWMKKVGDFIHPDEPLLEVIHDRKRKVIPSPAYGKLVRILVDARKEAEQDQPLAWIETEDDAHLQETQKITLRDEVRNRVGKTPVEETPEERLPEGENVSKKDVISYLKTLDQSSDLMNMLLNKAEEIKESGVSKPVDQVENERKPLSLTPIKRASSRRMETRKVNVQSEETIETSAPEENYQLDGLVSMEIQVNHILDHKNRNSRRGLHLPFFLYFSVAAISSIQRYSDILSGLGFATNKQKDTLNFAFANPENANQIYLVNSFDYLCLNTVEDAIKQMTDKHNLVSADSMKARQADLIFTEYRHSRSLVVTPALSVGSIPVIGISAVRKQPVVKEDDIIVKPVVSIAFSFNRERIKPPLAEDFCMSILSVIESWK